MFQKLLRQRRRVALAFLFAQMTCLAVWPSAYGAALTAIATVIVCAIIIMLAPTRRRWIECAAVGTFIAVWLPASLVQPGLIALPFALHALFYSSLLDRTGLRFAIDCHRKSQAPRPIDAVWAAIVPGVSHPDDHWSGALLDYDNDRDDDDTVYLRFRDADGLFDDMTVTFVERTAPHHVRYLRETGDDDTTETALVTLDLTALSDSRTEIRSQLQLDDLTPQNALGHWFDDTYGDELDHFAETLSAKQRWRISSLHQDSQPATAT